MAQETTPRNTCPSGLTRRDLLRLGAAGAGSLALPEFLRAWPLLSLAEPEPPAPFTIDPHTHIFNARDIAVAGFLRQVARNQRMNPFVKLYVWILFLMIPNKYEDAATVFVELLSKKSAPSIAEEREAIEAFLAGHVGEPDEQVRAAFWRRAREENDDLSGEMNEIVERAMTDRLRNSFTEEERAHILRFLTRAVAMRYQNAGRLLEVYGEDVALFAPSLVDMGLWLGDDAPFPMPEQIEVLSLISRLSGGRILPILAYDPWRQAFGTSKGEDRGEPLHWLQQAVEVHGFVGVKLYPPMGFHPLGNARHDSRKQKHWPEKARGYADFGAGLDQALRQLYEWCEREEVAVLAHAAPSMGAGRGYDKRAGPHGWRDVLREFPGLRLDLGHFGGWDNVEDGKGWTEDFARLMTGYEHVYGDVGNFVEIDEPKKRRELVKELPKLLQEFPRSRGRMLYASDWYMETFPDYVRDFRGALQAVDERLAGRGEPPLSIPFFSGNAAGFLGLRNGNKTRTRVDAFFARHGLRPAWRERLDADHQPPLRASVPP